MARSSNDYAGSAMATMWFVARGPCSPPAGFSSPATKGKSSFTSGKSAPPSALRRGRVRRGLTGSPPCPAPPVPVSPVLPGVTFLLLQRSLVCHFVQFQFLHRWKAQRGSLDRASQQNFRRNIKLPIVLSWRLNTDEGGFFCIPSFPMTQQKAQ
jgi:hypothetical protein